MKYKEMGKFGFLLDDVLELRPYQAATRWVRQRALELAVEYLFRKAMSLLRHETGNEISHRTTTAGADYLKAMYQLDWWHYEKKLRAALPGELKFQ